MDYLIRVFGKEVNPSKELKAHKYEIIEFTDLDEVFRWMEQNRDVLYSVYRVNCILDLS